MKSGRRIQLDFDPYAKSYLQIRSQKKLKRRELPHLQPIFFL